MPTKDPQKLKEAAAHARKVRAENKAKMKERMANVRAGKKSKPSFNYSNRSEPKPLPDRGPENIKKFEKDGRAESKPRYPDEGLKSKYPSNPPPKPPPPKKKYPSKPPPKRPNPPMPLPPPSPRSPPPKAKKAPPPKAKKEPTKIKLNIAEYTRKGQVPCVVDKKIAGVARDRMKGTKEAKDKMVKVRAAKKK